MSNALFHVMGCLGQTQPSSAATGPSSQPVMTSITLSPLLMTVASIGLCLLVAYTVVRIARPEKLRLLSAPGRPNRLEPAYVLALLAGYFLLGWGVKELLGFWLGQEPHKLTILSGVVSQVLWLPAVLVVAKATFPLGLRRGLGLSARHWFLDGLRAIVAYLAVFPVVLVLFWVGIQIPNARQHPLLEAQGDTDFFWHVLSLASAVVLAPLAEEVFFRGMVQSVLRRYFGSPWVAVALASVLFASIHMDLHTFPALTALGLVLGYSYERTGRLLAPILIHAFFNGVNMVDELSKH